MILSPAPRLLFALCALVALPLLLTGCESDDAYMAQNDAPPPQDVPQTPPEPQVEITPMISDPQSEIWLPGYWAYNGVTFHWVNGKVIHRPAPTAVWAPAHWVQHTYGWSFEKGHWE